MVEKPATDVYWNRVKENRRYRGEIRYAELGILSKMYNGIKPTRLWHLTGMKHFQTWIHDKVTARPRFEQRSKWEQLKIIALVTSALGTICYTYGLFSPKKVLTTIIRPPGTCDPPAKNTCVKPKITPPCPPD